MAEKLISTASKIKGDRIFLYAVCPIHGEIAVDSFDDDKCKTVSPFIICQKCNKGKYLKICFRRVKK